MGKPAVFDASTIADILRRRATGESTPSIARSLGTSHANVQNAIKRHGGQVEGAGEPDEFERAQLTAFERIAIEIEAGDHDARGLAALVKAQNDTIKAIRMYRQLSGTAKDDPEAGNRAADAVVARLQRLEASKKPVMPVSEAVPDESKAALGT